MKNGGRRGGFYKNVPGPRRPEKKESIHSSGGKKISFAVVGEKGGDQLQP